MDDWKERFRKKWPNVCMIQLWPDDGPNKHRDKEIGPAVEVFIESLLSEQKEQIRARIEKMNESYKTSNHGRAPYDHHGYSHACKDILASLDT
jgi:hypothetical protein